jgi:hypothetical protein
MLAMVVSLGYIVVNGGHMEKIGEVRPEVTPCDECGKPATVIVGKSALCNEHAAEKTSGVNTSLKSFTEPLDIEDEINSLE